MPHLLIHDLGDHRDVQLHGRVFYDGYWHDGVSFSSPYRKETLEALFKAKGDHLYDEIRRIEDPTYVKEQFIDLISRHVSLAGANVLDFGNGCASSSILLARAGASVTGVELMPDYRQAARLRVEDERVANRVAILETDDMYHLPFPKASFDLITLNAVVEHVRLEEREALLKNLWTYLKPGGVFVITETPNRLWPFDGHTTRLPFVPWLSLPWACRLARGVRPKTFGKKTNEALVYDGIVGATFWSVQRWLGVDARAIARSPFEERRQYLHRLRARKRGLWRVVVEVVIGWPLFLIAVALSLTTRRVPVNAFFPYLNLVFKKEV